MVTKKPPTDALGKRSMDSLELGTYYAILVSIAPLIDSILIDGIAYTKLLIPTSVGGV